MLDKKLSLLQETIFKKQEQGIAGDYVGSTVCWWLVQTRASAARWEDKVAELLQTNNYLFCEEKGMREAEVERG